MIRVVVARLVVVVLAVAGTAAPAAVTTAEYSVLQINMCNSGKSTQCYSGAATSGAGELINARTPTVVTMNEMCESDLDPIRRSTRYVDRGTFTQAGTETCTNGSAFGNTMLFPPGTDVGPVDELLYAAQDDPAEHRALTCAVADGVTVCVTHLATGGKDDGATRTSQATQMRAVIGDRADAGPTVLGGDWNLSHGGVPNAHDFVPAGMYRKGDGEVQHVVASDSFGFDRVSVLELTWTDHPGLQVFYVVAT